MKLISCINPALMQEETPHAAQAWKTVDKHILAKKISNHPPNPESSDGPGTVTVTFPTHAAVREIRGLKGGETNSLNRNQRNLSEASLLPSLQPELRETPKATHELVELSNYEGSHHKTRVYNGSGSGGVVREGVAPLSTAQPHPVVYRVVGSRHIKKADSSQQTENSAFRQVSSSHYKGGSGSLTRGDSRGEIELRSSKEKRNQSSNGVPRKPDKKRAGSKEELDIDYCNGERSSKGSSSGSSSGSGSTGKGKVRGAGPSFGYVSKKPTSNGSSKEPRSGQVQSVPRTKVKVSGGTQTEYSGPQLSAGVRERLMMGSPKSVARHPAVDSGSLSDSNYAEIPASATSPYSSAWLRHSGAGAYTASLPTRTSAAGTLIEAESIESLPAQLHHHGHHSHHRASLTHSRLIGSPVTAPRLSRSNSIRTSWNSPYSVCYLRDRTFPRSTKSEKLYPSMFQRSEEAEPYYSIPYNMAVGHHHSSQPTSPTPSQVSHGAPSRFNYPISPISSSPSSHGMNRTSPYIGIMGKINSKDDDVHGSAVSLVSTTSSLYSTPEEKQAHEVRKLRKELQDAQEKVHTLTNQLSTNDRAQHFLIR
ncbi:neuron navigator [Nesidiocoris tenuis]|uniref:Neuron navigator n=2 Tax=Nesidiocoris tenuis TaxID=355587 RepID=A0ABN7AMH0_9HEMI|nr:neuron navigator [Nesidiocoris tenuis]